MKAKSKKALSIGVLCTIILVIFVILNSLVQPIWYSWGTIYTAKGFYSEPKNSIETVFVGPSVAASGFSPTELYDEYGMCSYNLSSVKQPVMGSYYWVQEAYRKHPETLSTVVMEISSLRSTAVESYYHKCFDYMRFSKVKLEAVKDYANGDRMKLIEFLLPMAAYHDRWSDLKYTDLRYYVDDLITGLRGYYFTDEFFNFETVETVPVTSPVLEENPEPGVETVRDVPLDYFKKLVDFCNEKNIELVMVKVPTTLWDSYLHNEVQVIADENNLQFMDYNYAPYYEQMNYVMPFDTFDDHHLNYYGAYKMTNLVGEYLVENCKVTDVRGLEKYKYMEDQSKEYDARVRQQVNLNSAGTITEYLERAVSRDNAILITAKKCSADILSEDQVKFFKELGLDKLANIEMEDSYAAYIDKDGDVVYEEMKVLEKEETIGDKGSLRRGVPYKIECSYGKNDSSLVCQVRTTDHAFNEQGINIVVYNHTTDEVIDSSVFDTRANCIRDTYTVTKAEEVAAMGDDVDIDRKSITGQVRYYLQSVNDLINKGELRKNIDKDDVFDFLDTYYGDSDNLIIIAGGEDISEIVSESGRSRFSSYGLSKLGSIEYGDSYVAMIDGGSVEKEILRSGNKTISIEQLGLYVKSAGAFSENTCSIMVNGMEYAPDTKGLNIVVYNHAEDRVIDSINY